MADTPLGGEHARNSGLVVSVSLQSLVSSLQGPKQGVVSGGPGSSLLGPCFECGSVYHYIRVLIYLLELNVDQPSSCAF